MVSLFMQHSSDQDQSCHSDESCITLDRAIAGAIGRVQRIEDIHVAIVPGEMIRVLSVSARGSTIVQRVSGAPICLNRILSSCIWIQLEEAFEQT
ncbi:MAG: ferrous iron transport protein A [Alkalinema sp. RL_2_19]|nr:ferrous iron transport protein A [Alkalinema sp. RL_2_19]